MSGELLIRAIGRPARQGSKSAFVRGGRARMVEADKGLPQWRKDVIAAAKSAMLAVNWLPLDDPADVSIIVLLPRPRTVTRLYPDRKSDGDGDKYARAIFDALTLAGVWVDDSRAVDHTTRKRYADAQHPPGAIIRVRAMTEQGVLL